MDKKLKILSLDGGGAKGILTVKILAQIEQYLNNQDHQDIPIGNRFDLIAGTSIGGITALALSIGIYAKELELLYPSIVKNIFTRPPRSIICKILEMFSEKAYLIYKNSKYGNENLKNCLMKIFQEKTLKDCITNVLITSVAVNTGKPRLHKTHYFDRNIGRLNENLLNIALATSSAPIYFPMIEKMEESVYLVDGGLFANNPAMLALTDAIQILRNNNIPNQLENILLVSVGTGELSKMPYEIKNLTRNFLWVEPTIEMMLSSQSEAVHFQSKTLLNNNYWRINPKLTKKINLDDTDETTLKEFIHVANITSETEAYLNNIFMKNQKYY